MFLLGFLLLICYRGLYWSTLHIFITVKLIIGFLLYVLDVIVIVWVHLLLQFFFFICLTSHLDLIIDMRMGCHNLSLRFIHIVLYHWNLVVWVVGLDYWIINLHELCLIGCFISLDFVHFSVRFHQRFSRIFLYFC